MQNVFNTQSYFTKPKQQKHTLFNNQNAQRFTDKCIALTTIYRKNAHILFNNQKHNTQQSHALFNNQKHTIQQSHTIQQAHTLFNKHTHTHHLTTKVHYLAIKCTLFH